MPGAGKSVTANPTIVLLFIGRLAKAGEPHYYIARPYSFIGHYFSFGPAGRHGSVYSNDSHHIAYVGCFATKKCNRNSLVIHPVKKLLASFDQALQYFTR